VIRSLSVEAEALCHQSALLPADRGEILLDQGGLLLSAQRPQGETRPILDTDRRRVRPRRPERELFRIALIADADLAINGWIVGAAPG